LIVAVVASVYGGVEMYFIREAKRAAGANLQLPTLWLERGGDLLAGALFQFIFLSAAAWIVWSLAENSNVWLRQTMVIVLYLGFAAYALFT